MLDQKEFMKQLKAVCYHLFNRKLPFIVFDRWSPGSGEGINWPIWLFTNISYETILMYDSKPDYFCSHVMLQDPNFYTTFYQYFPLLSTTPCIIRAVDFVSSLSKVDDINLCSLNQISNEVVLSYPDHGVTIDKSIGVCLLDIDVEMYDTVYKSGIIPPVLPGVKEFTAEDLKEDKFIVEMDDGFAAEGHIPRKVRIIVQPGLLVPCLPLFLKNMKTDSQPAQTCRLETGYDGDSVLATSHYSHPFLCCNTTQPAQRWFVRRNNTLQKGNNHVGTETSKTQEQREETGAGQGLGKQDTGSQGETTGSAAACSGTCDSCSRGCKDFGTSKGGEEGA